MGSLARMMMPPLGATDSHVFDGFADYLPFVHNRSLEIFGLLA
jgi:hypothetical protein